MPWFRLKGGFGGEFNLRGTVFIEGEPLLVDDPMLAAKCRTLGYFDEVEPITEEPETKVSPSLFDELRSGLEEAASIANNVVSPKAPESSPVVISQVKTGKKRRR